MTTRAKAPWYRRLSLRVRMVLVTAGAVTVVLAAGGTLILLAVRAELVDAADEVGAISSVEVAQLAIAEDLPRILPVMNDPEVAVQVISKGRILASSRNLRRVPALDLPTQPVGTTDVVQVDSLPIDEGGPYRVTARGVVIPAGKATIYVAVSIEDLQDTMASARKVLAIGLALLVLVLSGVMWVVIGTTLAPVERIRRQASAITGEQLDRRVTEPIQHDEIGRLARTVNAMLGRLQDSADRQNRFLADAAHELRSPIASLRTQLETAGHRLGGDGPGLSIPDLLQETLRMQTMVDRLLLLARNDSGVLVPRRTLVDLDETIDDVVSSLMGPQVPVDLTDVQPAQVYGDPELLEQVVRNLVDNALRHAVHRVRLGLSSSDRFALLTVDDDGEGVPIDRRNEVFERFSRLDAARDREAGGVGLGLAIVAEVVEAHGGSIDVEDAPLGGARFLVRLPIQAEGPAAAPATTAAQRSGPPVS